MLTSVTKQVDEAVFRAIKAKDGKPLKGIRTGPERKGVDYVYDADNQASCGPPRQAEEARHLIIAGKIKVPFTKMADAVRLWSSAPARDGQRRDADGRLRLHPRPPGERRRKIDLDEDPLRMVRPDGALSKSASRKFSAAGCHRLGRGHVQLLCWSPLSVAERRPGWA